MAKPENAQTPNADILENDEDNLENEPPVTEKVEESENPDKANPEKPATEGNGEDPAAGEKPKADKPAENRIAGLVARLKAKDAELAEMRGRLNEQEKELAEDLDAVKAELPDLRYKGRPIYELSDQEFKQAKRELAARTDISEADKFDFLHECEDARDSYKEKVEPLVQESNKLSQDALKQWNDEWVTVSQEFLDMNPDFKEHLPRINAYMEKEFATRKTLVERLKKGPLEKFKYAQKVIQLLGIDKEVEQSAYAKDSDLSAAPTLGRGKQTAASEAAPREFTREQIRKMSLEEYMKNEEAIQKALREKRIK